MSQRDADVKRAKTWIEANFAHPGNVRWAGPVVADLIAQIRMESLELARLACQTVVTHTYFAQSATPADGAKCCVARVQTLMGRP